MSSRNPFAPHPAVANMLRLEEQTRRMLEPRTEALFKMMDANRASLDRAAEHWRQINAVSQAARIDAQPVLARARETSQRASRSLGPFPAIRELQVARNVVVHGLPEQVAALQATNRWLQSGTTVAENVRLVAAYSGLERLRELQEVNRRALRSAVPNVGLAAQTLNAAVSRLAPADLPAFTRKLADWAAAIEFGGAAGANLVRAELFELSFNGARRFRDFARIASRVTSAVFLRRAAKRARRRLLTLLSLPFDACRLSSCDEAPPRRDLANSITRHGPPALAAAHA